MAYLAKTRHCFAVVEHRARGEARLGEAGMERGGRHDGQV